MASRNRRFAATRPVKAADFSSLTDALLTGIFSFLSPYERCTAALVCRRWRLCSHSPELLRELDVTVCDEGELGLLRLQSLSTWLLQHAQHMRCLKLAAGDGDNTADQLQLLASCLGAIAALAVRPPVGAPQDSTAQLERLDVCWYGDGPFYVSAWAAALQGLRRMHLSFPGEVRVVADLGRLTRLTRLGMGGERVVLAPSTRLPTSLELVTWRDEECRQVPQQLAALARLNTLILKNLPCAAGAFSVLTQIRSLRWLDLTNCRHLPACLGQLSQLEKLALDSSGWAADDLGIEGQEEASLAVDAALRHLTQLTGLLIVNTPMAGTVPPSATGLTRLQAFCFGEPKAPQPAVQPWLPAGPWCHSLRSLAAMADMLLAAQSQNILATASCLEFVSVLGAPSDQGQGGLDAFCRWAQRHRPLRRVQFELKPGESVGGKVLEAVLALKAARPDLAVQCLTSYPNDSFYAELFDITYD